MHPDHPIGPHDVGGQPGPAVERDEHELPLWEKRVNAMMQLLRQRDLIRLDELRRNIEALGAETYHGLGYSERWVAAMTNVLLDRGVITSDALGRRMAELER
jgi:hypothetical protein